MEESKWCTAGMKEAPFYHEGMTWEEYEAEQIYFQENNKAWHDGAYIPLWRQKMIQENDWAT